MEGVNKLGPSTRKCGKEWRCYNAKNACSTRMVSPLSFIILDMVMLCRLATTEERRAKIGSVFGLRPLTRPSVAAVWNVYEGHTDIRIDSTVKK